MRFVFLHFTHGLIFWELELYNFTIAVDSLSATV